MRCRFVVKVTDVFYSPVNGAKVDVFTAPTVGAARASTDFKTIAATGPGVHPTGELDIAEFEVNVSHPSFFGVNQKGRVQPGAAGALPKVTFGANSALFEQELSSYDLVVHTHDGGLPVVELYIALGRLFDSTSTIATVADIFRRPPPSLGKVPGPLEPRDRNVHVFTKDLLATNTARGPFDFQIKSLPPVGKSLFATWKPTPDTNSDPFPGRNMIAIYDLTNKFTKGTPKRPLVGKSPINYHIFLHPSTSWFPDPRYPTGSWWLDLVGRYVYGAQVSGIGKAMANQLHHSGKLNTVLIFPIGSGTRMHNDLTTQDAVMRLVHEVSYFIQRRAGVRYPLQPVGSVGISAFSSAISFVNSILRSPPPRIASGASIREVFDLDGRVMVNNRVSAPGMAQFAAFLRTWFLQDPRARAVRSYSQLGDNFAALQGADPSAKVTTRNGCNLLQGDSVTCLFAPLTAWTFFFTEPQDPTKPIGPGNPPKLNQAGFPNKGPDMPVHDIIPAWFLQHALSVAKHD